MPFITGRTKKLSPLEESPIHDPQSKMTEVPVVSRVKGADAIDSVDRQAFVEIGTAILLARSCDVLHGGKHVCSQEECSGHCRPSSLQECEIFQPIQPQSLSVMRREMERLWDQGVPMTVEVKGQSLQPTSEVNPPEPLLLEQWTLQVVPKRSQCAHSPIQYLHQAVSSFLHFSQIRSWMVASKGLLPFQLLFRVCAPGEDEEHFTVSEPDSHSFPLAVVREHYSLVVMVRCLPRLQHIPFALPGGTSSSAVECQTPVVPGEKGKELHQSSPKHINTRRIFSCIDDLCDRTSGLLITPDTVEPSITGGTGSRSKCASADQLSPSFPFSPPQPSPMSPKLLSGLADVLPYCKFQETEKLEEGTNTNDSNGAQCPHFQTFCFERGCAPPQPVAQAFEETPRSKLNQNSGSLFPRRAVSCSYPSGVCPPSASSPVPFIRKAANEKRKSLAINIKRPIRPPVRSNSAPSVVPSLYLLGTFEESVLNGRLEPCGYVDGFTAELGASGSFCPRHITLPVAASFFSLAEHGGSSPYLGQIDLSNVGKRGYRVPKRGTVQVTLLNPNKTVVKIYFVKYDFSDMPPNSQTFLRHKTLSRFYLGSPDPLMPVLHYLIHLRFLCSKSGHLYLHRDIRLIFARRAPDTDPDLSKVSLYVTTEGPTDPKYGPIH